MKTTTLILAALLMVGCASHKSTVLRIERHGDVEVKELTRSATRTLFDSKTRLADNAVSQKGGSNAQSIAIGSLAQQSSGSNVVQLLKETAVILERLEELKTGVPGADVLREALKKRLEQEK